MSLVGELDIHNDKLYIKLHNFEFISTNTPASSSSSILESVDRTSSSNYSASKKRSQLYDSLDEQQTTTPPKHLKKESKPAATSTSTADKSGEERVNSKNKPATKTSSSRRTLRSNDTPTLNNLASDVLKLPSYEEP